MTTHKERLLQALRFVFLSFFPFFPTFTTTPTLKTKFDLCAYIPPHDTHVRRDDAVEIAFKKRKDLEAFLYAEQASRYDERIALAGYLPQIQLGAQIGRCDPDQFFPGLSCRRDSISNRGLTLTLSQLIFNGGGPIIDYKIAQEATKIVQENMKLTQDTVRINVETAFLNMQRFMLEKTFIESRDIASKALLEQSSGKNKVGFLNESTWLASNATYVTDQTTIANYTRDTQTALWNLQRQTGSDITSDKISMSLEDATKIDLKDLNFYLEKAAQTRPQLKIQDHMIRQAQLSQKKYGTSYIPSVAFFAEASDIRGGETLFETASPTGISPAITAGWSFGLNFTWNFDGLANAHAERRSNSQEIQYVLQKKDLELQVKQDVESAYNQVKNNIDLLTAAIAQSEQADATLQLKTKQFEVGTISRIDLAQAELTYESALFQLDASKLDTRIAYQNLLFACGYPKIGNHCI